MGKVINKFTNIKVNFSAATTSEEFQMKWLKSITKTTNMNNVRLPDWEIKIYSGEDFNETDTGEETGETSK